MGAALSDDTQPRTFLERDDWMRAVCASDLPPVTARVAVRIGLHLNVTSGQCNPGIDKIATGTNISERSAYRQVAALRRAGWITIRRGGGRERSNEYTLTYPDTALSGFKSLNSDRARQETLTERVINPDNRWQTKRGTAKRTGAGAHTPAPRERENGSLALTVIPGAPAPVGGAPEEKNKQEVVIAPDVAFLVLWMLWSSVRPHPDTDKDKTDARLAFAVVGRDADPDEIIAAARERIAAAKADNPRFLPKLAIWLSNNNWRKEPPQRKPTRNGGKVSLSRLAIEESRDGGDQS
jgi:hypothetical protein